LQEIRPPENIKNTYENLEGRKIDVFTQKGGQGLYTPDGSFGPLERVILYANVTYNGAPRPGVIVGFQVKSPSTLYDFAESNITREDGICCIDFVVPWPNGDWSEVVGTWTAIASVNIQGVVVKDSVDFFVEYPVRVMSSEVGTRFDGKWFERTAVYQLDCMEVATSLRSLTPESINVVVCLSVFDGANKNFFSLKQSLTLYGNTTELLSTNFGMIPLSAAGGNGRVRINVFNKDPAQGGSLLCPEYSFNFELRSRFWWDYDWNYRRRVEIAENSGCVWTNCSVEVVFEHGGNVQADGSDIRVVDKTIVIPSSVMECNSTHARVMFETSLVARELKTVYIYYGNMNVSSLSIKNIGATTSGSPTALVVSDKIVAGYEFSSIQEAIYHSNEEDTIFVKSGMYIENVIVDKSVSIVGEKAETTIIDGGSEWSVLEIVHDNATVMSLTIENSGGFPYCGILLNHVKNCNITGNIIINNGYGVKLQSASDNVLRNNVMINNTYNFGVFGVDLLDFMNDVHVSNTINGKPIHYWVSKHDASIPLDAAYVALVNCTNITVNNLNLIENGQGLLLAFTTNSTIVNNNIARNENGLWLLQSTGNSIFHNNFIENLHHTNIYKSEDNLWDDGYPSGGNYWNAHTISDFYRGVYQNETGSDGINDTSYFIFSADEDKYPLTKPYSGSVDIGLISIGESKTVVCQGGGVFFAVKIVNYGVNAETFNLTLYANSSLIQSFDNIRLTSRNSTTITFKWNGIGFDLGNYVISASITQLVGEVDLTDNTRVGEPIILTLMGDVNGDFKVDGKDIGLIAKAFDTRPDMPRWNPNADVNSDFKIDGKDIGWTAKNLGKQFLT